MASTKKRLLIMVDWYEPAFKAGGPIRSVVNIVANLNDLYDIYIYTGDRDLGDERPFEEVQIDNWNIYSGYSVFYASKQNQYPRAVLSIISSVNPDFIYINSMFSLSFSLYAVILKRLGLISGQLVLAPRGMLKRSAIRQKRLKKALFLNLFRTFGLQRQMVFQATDNQELVDIKRWFGIRAKVFIVPNLPGRLSEFCPPPRKEAGYLKMIFVGRIHPIKNLNLLLRALSQQDASIHLTVVAPIEDQEYWNKCGIIIASLPGNVTVDHLENIPHQKVESIIRNNHIFALPTAGENFGHAIFEALSAGRPVLISDQTPWRNLQSNKAGWDVSLVSPDVFSDKIRLLAGFDEPELMEWCKGAWDFCKKYLERSNAKELYIKLFS